MKKFNVFAVFFGVVVGIILDMLLLYLVRLLFKTYLFQYPNQLSRLLWITVLPLFLATIPTGMVATLIAKNKYVLHSGLAGFFYAFVKVMRSVITSFSKLAYTFKGDFLFLSLEFFLIFLIAVIGGVTGGSMINKFGRTEIEKER